MADDNSPTFTLAQIAAALAGGQSATPSPQPAPSSVPQPTVNPAPNVAQELESLRRANAALEQRLAAAGSEPKPATAPQVPPQHPADLLPRNDPGAPQGLPIWERPSNPFLWTEEDVARITAQKGVRAAQKLIRQKAEEFARTIRLNLPTKR